jgi:hypothetical protein
MCGLHHVNMNSPRPLAWDLLLFAVFRVWLVIAGFLLKLRFHPADGHSKHR